MLYTKEQESRLRDQFAIAFITRVTAGESFADRAQKAYQQADECIKARGIVDPVVEFGKAVEKVVQEATGKSPTDVTRAEWLEKAKAATCEVVPFTIATDEGLADTLITMAVADVIDKELTAEARAASGRLAAIRRMLEACGGAEGILACINVGNPAPLNNLVYEIMKGAE